MWYVDGTPLVKGILGQAWADPRGAAKNACPWGPNSFIFIQFFWQKICKIIVSTPTLHPFRKILDMPLLRIYVMVYCPILKSSSNQ